MKRLLLPVLAVLALSTAVNAESVFNAIKTESVYLVVKTTSGSMMWENGQLMVVPMKIMAGFEEAGLKIISSKRFNKGKITRDISFEFLESK